jgi:hypothetical protein
MHRNPRPEKHTGKSWTLARSVHLVASKLASQKKKKEEEERSSSQGKETYFAKGSSILGFT